MSPRCTCLHPHPCVADPPPPTQNSCGKESGGRRNFSLLERGVHHPSLREESTSLGRCVQGVVSTLARRRGTPATHTARRCGELRGKASTCISPGGRWRVRCSLPIPRRVWPTMAWHEWPRERQRLEMADGGWAALPKDLLPKVLEAAQGGKPQEGGLGFSKATAVVSLVCAGWKAVHDALVGGEPQDHGRGYGHAGAALPGRHVGGGEGRRRAADTVDTDTGC